MLTLYYTQTCSQTLQSSTLHKHQHIADGYSGKGNNKTANFDQTYHKHKPRTEATTSLASQLHKILNHRLLFSEIVKNTQTQ